MFQKKFRAASDLGFDASHGSARCPTASRHLLVELNEHRRINQLTAFAIRRGGYAFALAILGSAGAPARILRVRPDGYACALAIAAR
ncbi:MAG: hypothetical protein QOJ88_1245 [Pyrinomonadaceae bacterium]|nr:hypothetical protein [Pyrinomonadaceae bacterium]